MSDVTAVGELVGAGMAARSIEPKAGEVGADGHTHETTCLNCGAALVGAFCQNCGQHAHVHRTLSAFFHDLAHGVFHFEGKTWRTVPLLVWRPGELTRRYIEGQRARFVSPMALFLFTVFLMFAVVSNLAPIHFGNEGQIASGMNESIGEDRAALVSLHQQRAEAFAKKQPTAAIDAKIKSHADDLKMLETMREKGFIKGTTVSFADGAPDFIREPVRKAAANPDLTIYKLKSSAYKWSWALIPLSVPFVWLLFPFGRRFRLYDHTVFVTYSLSFMSMLVVVLTLWSAIGLPGVAVAATFIPPIHMYRQLKGAYSLGRASALLRTFVIGIFASIVLTMFVVLMLAIGILD